MVGARKLIYNNIRRQMRVIQTSFDKALELRQKMEYFDHNRALYDELKSKLCALEAMNQAKDALLQQYITEYKATEPIKIEFYEQIRTDQ